MIQNHHGSPDGRANGAGYRLGDAAAPGNCGHAAAFPVGLHRNWFFSLSSFTCLVKKIKPF